MLERIKTELEATGIPIAHFAWQNAPEGEYLVYAEDGAEDFMADNHHAEKGITGTVDLFTRNDTEAPKTTVEAALDASGAAWYLNSIQYEEDTGYIHYEWVVGLYGA